MSIGISGGLCGRGGRLGSLHSGSLYLDCLGGSLSSKDDSAVDRSSDLQGTIGGDARLGCSCDKGYSWV